MSQGISTDTRGSSFIHVLSAVYVWPWGKSHAWTHNVEDFPYGYFIFTKLYCMQRLWSGTVVAIDSVVRQVRVLHLSLSDHHPELLWRLGSLPLPLAPTSLRTHLPRAIHSEDHWPLVFQRVLFPIFRTIICCSWFVKHHAIPSSIGDSP